MKYDSDTDFYALSEEQQFEYCEQLQDKNKHLLRRLKEIHKCADCKRYTEKNDPACQKCGAGVEDNWEWKRS